MSNITRTDGPQMCRPEIDKDLRERIFREIHPVRGATMRRVVIAAAIATALTAGAGAAPAPAASSTPTWTKIGSYSPPVIRYGHAMARDVTGRTLVFGGLTIGSLKAEADTWRWGGERWMRLAPETSPPERTFPMMAYDAARKETVLFGGIGASGALADTWVWNGETWTQRTSTISPPPRSMGSMAWDAATQKVILFGGATPGNSALGDTWSWDGTSWLPEASLASPPPRWGFGLADGSASSKPVLFGGTPPGLAGLVFFGDTWTWDGLAHTWLPAAVIGPSARAGVQMAYDPARGNVVLHGGYARPQGNPLVQENFADTWVWDGTAWTQQTPPRSPSFTTRFWSAFAYDAVEQRVRLFGGASCTPTPALGCLGGYANDTWGWDGTTWHQEDLTAPNEMQKPMFARDPVSGAVMFGGQYEYGHYSQETWRWDGAEWELLDPENKPLPRGMAAITFIPPDDPQTSMGTTILFGGHVDTLGLGGTRQIYQASDTWSWDGTDWSELQPETSPPPRSEATIAYDAVHDEVVMFGGVQGNNAKDDTWVWDGAGWIEKHPATSPPARIGGSMAYDPLRGEIVLFGGMMSQNTGYHADTWVWDGESWTEILTPPGGSPPARAFGGMGWDPSTQTVVYFGGCSNCYANPTHDETWSWDGASWTRLDPAPAPERRTSFAMLSGDGSDPLLMFGGRRAVLTLGGATAQYPEGTAFTNEVWEFGA